MDAPVTPEEWMAYASTLEAQGFRADAVEFRVNVVAGVDHAYQVAACPGSAGGSDRVTSMGLLIKRHEAGRLCPQCLEQLAFRERVRDRELTGLLQNCWRITRLLGALEAATGTVGEQLGHARALKRLAGEEVNPGHYINAMLTSELTRRIKRAQDRARALGRSPAGREHYAQECAAAHARAQGALPAWMKAPPAGPDGAEVLLGRVSLVRPGKLSIGGAEVAEVIDAFTDGELMMAPSIVFDALGAHVVVEDFVVLPEDLSAVEVETVKALYDPRGPGAYTTLTAALAAARVL